MKRLPLYLLVICTLLGFVSCSTIDNKPAEAVQVVYVENVEYSEMAEFASDEIQKAAVRTGLSIVESGARWVISFDGIEPGLGEQAYRIEVSADNHISITGGDATGLMYGGLEVAEQIDLGKGIGAVVSCEDSPFVLNRGIKFDIPLDMRIPSYSDSGDSSQQNIETMWDLDFWKKEIDTLARYRYNTLTLWNLNPFPSMVKVEQYPDIALDDVWKTTLPFDDTYNGTGSNLVREEHWKNYQVVKRITIDQKIDFWRQVMAYAKSRGIETYIITWNVYTFGEQGKYGITNDIDNEVTKDYYRQSVKAMVETYPDLAGIGFTVGENMKWDPGMEISNEQWLFDTYGKGVMEALADSPDRDFRILHRLHLAEFDLIQEVWKDFTGTLDYCDNYAAAHMLTMTKPTLSDDVLSVMPEGEKIWMTLRSDDIYSFSWCDADFVRDYMMNLPEASQLEGYMVGGDGIIPAKDFTSTDESLKGQLYIEKQWLFNMLWGRMGYNPQLSDDFIKSVLASRYPGFDVSTLFEVMNSAAKIIPQVSRQYFQRGDATWFPEASWSNPSIFGYLDILRWMKSVDAMKDSGVLSIADYCEQFIDGKVDESMQTPLEVSAALNKFAANALQGIEKIRSYLKKSKSPSLAEKEYLRLVSDQEAMAYLGLYYSEKIIAAVNLRLFNDTKDSSYQELCVSQLEKALEHWRKYASIASSMYEAQRYGRQGYVDLNEITASVENDIEKARKYWPRPISKGITI